MVKIGSAVVVSPIDTKNVRTKLIFRISDHALVSNNYQFTKKIYQYRKAWRKLIQCYLTFKLSILTINYC